MKNGLQLLVGFVKFAIFGINSTSWQLTTSNFSHFTKVALVDTLNPNPTYTQGFNAAAYRRGWTGLPSEACLSRHGWTLEGTLIFTVPKDIRPSGGHSGGGGGGGCVFFGKRNKQNLWNHKMFTTFQQLRSVWNDWVCHWVCLFYLGKTKKDINIY